MTAPRTSAEAPSLRAASAYPAGIYPGAMPASLPSPAAPRSGEGRRPTMHWTVRRQREIAALTALAVCSTQVHAARLLGVSDRTMRRYLLSAERSLGAATAVHAVALAASIGLLDPERLKARTVPPWPQDQAFHSNEKAVT